MYTHNNAKEQFKKTIIWLEEIYAGIHTGRATPSVLDSITIESYGAQQPIKNIGSISIEDAKTLRIVPWDKNHIKDIEKSIMLADLGLSTSIDSEGIRIIFPLLTAENRQKLVKTLKEKLEDARISVRKIREEMISQIKEDGLPEDDARRAKDELQKIVDETNTSLEAVFSKKENEVLNN
jgi:ribosome recycling factor